MTYRTEARIKYDPPKPRWLIKIGRQYYRRMQPVPWAYMKPDLRIFVKHHQPITEKPTAIPEAAPDPAATESKNIQSAPRARKIMPAHKNQQKPLF